MTLTRNELVARLIRAGELEVSGENKSEVETYFDTDRFRFHGPDGLESDYQGLSSYFESLRSAFVDRSIRRGIIIVEGEYIACQTWIAGRFVHEFSQSPVGLLSPNGEEVTWDLSNIFRVDERGRLIEEWVRTDNRSVLRQLGVASVSCRLALAPAVLGALRRFMAQQELTNACATASLQMVAAPQPAPIHREGSNLRQKPCREGLAANLPPA